MSVIAADKETIKDHVMLSWIFSLQPRIFLKLSYQFLFWREVMQHKFLSPVLFGMFTNLVWKLLFCLADEW